MKKQRTPLKAIRAKCIDCSGHQVKEVKRCPVIHCALWPYRMGRGYLDPSKPYVSVGGVEDLVKGTEDHECSVNEIETVCFAGEGENGH